MPIDYKLYPENWLTEIRPRILKRANNCCEFCGVVNYSVGYWIDNKFYNLQEIMDELDNNGIDLCENIPIEKNPVKIVLTIMHLEHDISLNEDKDLAAGCQRCHNNYDRKNRNKNIKVRKMKNQLTLF